MHEIIIRGTDDIKKEESQEVREYAMVRYRMRKQVVRYNPYKLEKPRIRLLHMNKLAEFQLDLRRGGHQLLGVNRLTKEEYEEKKQKMKAKKEAREGKAHGTDTKVFRPNDTDC